MELRRVSEHSKDAEHRRRLSEAAGKILAEHGDFIRTVIRFRVHDASITEDLFQEFFLRLVCRPVPANVENVRGWLYQAIIHDAVDLTRRNVKYTFHMKKYAEEARISIYNKPSKNAIGGLQERDSRFEYLVRNLRRREAQVVTMRYRDNCSIAEIAERIGIHRRTVSRYLTSALSQLRRTLAAE